MSGTNSTGMRKQRQPAKSERVGLNSNCVVDQPNALQFLCLTRCETDHFSNAGQSTVHMA